MSSGPGDSGRDSEFEPVVEEATEVESPRREKSAEFDVAGAEVDGAMIDAMDPANQSLADALRLSYRVLQLAILGLAVVFLFSGFQTIRENSTGVRTLFGRVVGEGSDAAIGTGLQPFWPYPVGEIVTVPMKRTVQVDRAFFPNLRVSRGGGAIQDLSLDQATESADVTRPIRPGPRGDGSLILRGGDLAHCRMTAEYSIDDPVAFLTRFTAEDADEVVRMALERAAVHVAASLTLADFIDDREASSRRIQDLAQDTLRGIDSGIRLATVSVTDRVPPLSVRKSVQGVQAARERAKIAVEVARRESATILDDAAGAAAFEDIVAMIGRYETAIGLGDEAEGDRVLVDIGARFDESDIGGDAAATLTRAKAYRSMIDSGLGTFARRVDSLSASYRENPAQLVRQLWLDAYREVLDGSEVEVLSAPPGLGGLALRMKSSADIASSRRDTALERRTQQTLSDIDLGSFQLGSRQISIDKAGRRLQRDASGGFGREEPGQ
jgi:regulator of protease activity HflC (stomatin/prohibitin superfamily)